MRKINCKRIGNHNLPVPKRETTGAAGYDLRAVQGVDIAPGKIAEIKTGFAVDIPSDCVGIIFPRSGLAFKYSVLLANVGIIDSDFRGEIKVLLQNVGKDTYYAVKGDRIAQLVILKMPELVSEISEVEELSETERGASGFGSTGK